MPSATEGWTGKVVVVLVVYCVSGTLLTLANKVAVASFPYPNALLVLQNAMAVAILSFASWASAIPRIPKLTWSFAKAWVPLVLLFVTMLVTSLLALMRVSASTLVVIRNLSTLCVALLEWFVLGTRSSSAAVVSMTGMLIGAVLYGFFDLTFDAVGYFWLFVNVASTSAYQTYVKVLIKRFTAPTPTPTPTSSTDGREEGRNGANQSLPAPVTAQPSAAMDLSATSMSYFNNLLSLPFLAVVAGVNGELPHVGGMFNNGAFSTATIIVSGLLGCALSITAFQLNKLISATSMMVANNVNKFLIILISEVFFKRALGPISFVGTIVVILFAWIYSQSRTSTITEFVRSRRRQTAVVAALIAALLVFGITAEVRSRSIPNKGPHVIMNPASAQQ